jgi:hypothetical protein
MVSGQPENVISLHQARRDCSGVKVEILMLTN